MSCEVVGRASSFNMLAVHVSRTATAPQRWTGFICNVIFHIVDIIFCFVFFKLVGSSIDKQLAYWSVFHFWRTDWNISEPSIAS